MELSKDFAGEIPEEMNSSNIVNEIAWTEWWILNFMLYNFYSAHTDCRQRLGGSDSTEANV